jgi:hypothetical protein
MTDLPHSPDDELVTAVLDGEATADERARVADDPALARRLEELSRVRDAVAEPVGSLDELTARRMREQALAAAPATMSGRVDGSEARGTSRPWWQGGSLVGIGSVAAVVLVALLVVPALLAGGDDADTAAGDHEATTMDATELRSDAFAADEADDAGDAGSSPQSDGETFDEVEVPAPELGAPRPWLGRFDSPEDLAAEFGPSVVDADSGPTTSTDDGAAPVDAVPECPDLEGFDELEIVEVFDAWVGGQAWVVLQVLTPDGESRVLGVDLDSCEIVPVG